MTIARPSPFRAQPQRAELAGVDEPVADAASSLTSVLGRTVRYVPVSERFAREQ
jgi:hypothetical protein